jgi:hypothetical protein
MRPNAAKEELK